MDKKIFDLYANISGFLKKKQGKLSLSSEKRYFRIINGKIIAYSEKEDTKLKGIISIESIIKIEVGSKKDLSFKIVYPNKNYDLCAKTEEQKNLWVSALQELRKEIFRIKHKKILSEEEINTIKENENNEDNKETDKKEKNWKTKRLDRDTFDVK